MVTSAYEPVTRIRDVILDPDTGKVVGFFTMGGANRVIASMDIISWNSAIEIHDPEDVISVEEVAGIERALEKGRGIYKNKVYTKSGQYVGKVMDIGMNNKLFELTCLIVMKGFLGLFFWDKKIISARDILEVKKDRVIVKDLVTPVKMEKLKVDMAATS